MDVSVFTHDDYDVMSRMIHYYLAVFSCFLSCYHLTFLDSDSFYNFLVSFFVISKLKPLYFVGVHFVLH
jgi:hypothetical protein